MLHRKGTKIAAGLIVLCMLLCAFVFVIPNVYAEPTEEPATVEEAEPLTAAEGAEGAAAADGTEAPAGDAEAMPDGAPVSDAAGTGVVTAAEEGEEEGNIMDTLMKADRVWLGIFKKILTRLFIVLLALIVAVIAITIYIMITQTARTSKQNQLLSRRPSKAAVPAAGAAVSTNKQVTEFGDTLRIRRNAAGNAASANMQRPVAPQRPSRPQQSVQPGVRRPAQPMQGQPARRPLQPGQPTRNAGARPVQPSRMAQPIRQPQRPAAPAAEQPKDGFDLNDLV